MRVLRLRETLLQWFGPNKEREGSDQITTEKEEGRCHEQYLNDKTF